MKSVKSMSSGDSNGKSAASGSSGSGSGGGSGGGAARVDRLIESHRDLLAQPCGDALAAEVRARLSYPWCADLPVVVSKRLPLVRRLWISAKRWAWRLMLVYMAYVTVSATVGFYFEKQIEEWHKSDLSTDLGLAVNFATRRLAVWLGLPRMDRLQELNSECVVDNPLYRKPLLCCNCKFNLTLSKVNNVEKVMENFDKLTSTGKPRSFVIVNYDQEPVSFRTIRETALANEADLNIGYNRFTTLSGPRVSGLRQLFANETDPPADSAVLWRFNHVEGLRHFRALVHRPAFVSRDLEINLGRQFLFFGEGHTDRVPLGSLSELDGQVYVVGLAGEIVFTVKSNPQCCKKAENKVVRAAALRPGRLLSLPSGCYEVSARRNGTEYAAAYMGSVSMSQHPASERGPKSLRK